MKDVSINAGTQREPNPRAGDRADGPAWRSAEFQHALRRAQAREKDPEPEPQAQPQPDAAASPLRREALTFKADTEEAGKVDIVAGAAERNLAAPAVEPAAAPPGSPTDLQSFATMLDRAWVGAFADGAKAMQVRFLDQSLPMSGLQMVRLPDGAMSLTLAASGQAVPQVSRTLETLRRRLEARGLDILDLNVEAETEDAARHLGRRG